MGKMIFTVLGAVAELERNLIRERILMGLTAHAMQSPAQRLQRDVLVLGIHSISASVETNSNASRYTKN
jgi:hypothetical protein